MPYFPFLNEPVSAGAPCGCDADDDPAIQSYLMILEGSLPSTYLGFNRQDFDHKAIIEQLTAHLKKSRDVRLLTLAIKTFALSENLEGFFEALSGLANLMESQWDEAHPRASGGDYALRSAYVQALEDRAILLLPLQATALIKDKKLGPISFRSFMLAQSPSGAREGETVNDESTLADAFMQFEPLEEIVSLRDQAKAAIGDFGKLRSLFVDKIGYEAAPKFELVPNFLTELVVKLDKFIADRAPSDAPAATQDEPAEGAETEAQGTTPAASEIVSVKEVSAALQAVLNYYTASEPSSPAKLLVRQAHQLVGKSFVEAMRVLAPGLVENTKIDIAGGTPFSLNFDQLLALAEAEQEATESEAPPPREFSVRTRHEASETMKSVERFYRRHEPSSPIPLLLDRARKFVARDFASLLAEMAKQPST